jgi:hypothetical protein
MEHSADIPPLTTVQQCVVDALAAGSTITDAAEAHGVHRVTVYRWMKTSKPFSDALHRARAEFVLARRDDLHHLSNRALETLLAILDNPRSSPAVLLRTSVFILQRPQQPKTGWSMPEPAPDPDGKKLLDSAIIEQDYDSLPGLCNIESDEPVEDEEPLESTTSDPQPPAAAPPCNNTQHDSENFDAPPAPPPGFRSCPVPPDVLKARRDHQKFLDLMDEIDSIEHTSPIINRRAPPSDTDSDETDSDECEEIVT